MIGMHGMSYPASVDGIGGLGDIGGAPFVYIPDLAPVGSGNAYFPRSVEADAAALNFLGFLPSDSQLSAPRQPSQGSQAADMADNSGAWDPEFRGAVKAGAVTRFQASDPTSGLVIDSWIGPATRTAIAFQVQIANANGLGGGVVPVLPPAVIPVVPGNVPVAPNAPPIPGVTPVPAAASSSDETLTYVAIGAGVLAVGGILWWAFAK